MIGNKIKKIRELKNLSQEEFANKIYSTKSTISKWENGKANPSLNDIDQIANIFGVDVSFFISDGSLNKKEKASKQTKKPTKKIVATIDNANYSGLTNINLNNKSKVIAITLSWVAIFATGIGLFISTFGAKNGIGKKEIAYFLAGTILILVGAVVIGIHMRMSNRWARLKRENAIVKISNIDFEIISKKSNKSIFVEYPNIFILKVSNYSQNESSIEISINDERKLTLLKADKSVISYINKMKGGN